MPKTWFSNLSKKQLKYIILALIILFLVANKGFVALIVNFTELQTLQKEHLALQEENKKLQSQLKLLQSDKLMESEARKMGFTKPKEIEYRFPPLVKTE